MNTCTFVSLTLGLVLQSDLPAHELKQRTWKTSKSPVFPQSGQFPVICLQTQRPGKINSLVKLSARCCQVLREMFHREESYLGKSRANFFPASAHTLCLTLSRPFSEEHLKKHSASQASHELLIKKSAFL